MRIDHLALNVDGKIHKGEAAIQSIMDSGFPYEPAKYKGTG